MGASPFDDFIKAATDLADDVAKGIPQVAGDVVKGASGIVDGTGKVLAGAADEAGAVLEGAANATGGALAGAVETIVSATSGAAGAVADTAGSVAGAVGDAAVGVVSTVQANMKEAKDAELERYHASIESTLSSDAAVDLDLIPEVFGPSPTELTFSNANKAKEAFPIPREQHVLWLDAEFDLRPSGIALTEEGVFIRSDVSPVQLDSMLKGEEAKTSSLRYVRWEYFDPSAFTTDAEDNFARSVAEGHADAFIGACDWLESCLRGQSDGVNDIKLSFAKSLTPNVAPVVASSGVFSSKEALFVGQKAQVNLDAGHGEMAERFNHMADVADGKNAEWLGPLNEKNGADRVIHQRGMADILIQTKYYSKWRGTLEAGFDSKTGQYRYIHDGRPMQLEVPSDQYERVLEGFRIKIREGKVPGIDDPGEAENIVRCGRLTYAQAKNLTKPGTIESLKYDAMTGVVTCSCAMGFSFVATTFLAWNEHGDLGRAVQSGAAAGVQVFGLSFAQHILISQIARTGLAKSLVAPTEQLVGKLGSSATRTIVNGVRVLSGQSAISGAAATKSLARMVRSNGVAAAVSMAVFSVPETYRLVARKISGTQYAKNMAALAGSVVGGIGGTVAAGVAAAKVASVVGTGVAPGVGTAVGFAGGLIGGTLGSAVVGAVGGILHEDDVETMGRLLNAVVSCMAVEYMLDEREIDVLADKLGEISQDEMGQLFEKAMGSDCQEKVFRDYLDPIFEKIVSERESFTLPSWQELLDALGTLVPDGC